MSNPTAAGHTSPEVLKRMEKDLTKAGKVEENSVKHAMKDLAATEKSKTKAAKSADKAEHLLAKNQTKELKAAKAVNKATHSHDVALGNLQQVERNLKIKQQNDAKLAQELEMKKVRVEAAIKSQEVHNQEREEKLAHIKSEREAMSAST
ncbi:hypothetical protein HGRIS_009870 [Hohenbuehelia grisea]|uniref:Uncharacterized protein n=1 Tax=Hohenbuehelia grisea TaxID=104357 RepID=A0ABR3J2H2_9AGAR